MQKLSEVLENTPEFASAKTNNTLSIQAHGYRADAGTTNTLTLAPRQNKLTEKELTAIASKLLLQSPVAYWTKRKIYGRKEIEGVWHENEPIGEEDAIDISLPYRADPARELMEAALRQSPASGTIDHLKRLAMHKRLGSDDKDRAMLLHDYADALRAYSEFTVYLACKSLWENTINPFYPKIAELRELCEAIHLSFRQKLNTCLKIEAPKKPVYVRPEDTDDGKKLRRELCDFLVSKGLEDRFESHCDSNYQLEILAKGKGWKKEPPEANVPSHI